MTRTMWIALFCLVGLGPAVAIRVVTLPASLAVEPARDPDKTEMAPAPNESAKSDRLELPDIRAEARITPSPQAASVEMPSTGPETINSPGRRWQDANARASGESLPRTGSGVDTASREESASNNNKEIKGSRTARSEPPHRHAITRKQQRSVGNNPPKPKAEVWHCRQDSMGSLLRSLNLAPRCDL